MLVRMKREMDLVREILLAVEQMPYAGATGSLAPSEFKLDGRTTPEVCYHTTLLAEARLIEVAYLGSDTIGRDETGTELEEQKVIPIRLTWEGHEFLDNARDVTRWSEARDRAGGAGFRVLTAILVDLPKKAVGL